MEHVKTVPHVYQTISSQKATTGKMGNSKRWSTKDGMVASPGVGDYDLTQYKRLDKASETHFYHRKMSAKVKSPSRDQRLSSGNKLGGPS
jgi:hypothetical protein